MERTIGIYKITSPSGKIYIGQSNNILFRWNYHYKKLHCKKQRHLYNSLLKYGFEAHTLEILKLCKSEELNTLESYYINKFESTNRILGLNHRHGGNGKVTSESSKELMRINALGNTNRLGCSHSEETKHRISTSRKGTLHSAETKKRMSITRIGRIVSEDTKEKLSKANKFTRKIQNCLTNINHESITIAALIENVSQSTIYRGLKKGTYVYIN